MTRLVLALTTVLAVAVANFATAQQPYGAGGLPAERAYSRAPYSGGMYGAQNAAQAQPGMYGPQSSAQAPPGMYAPAAQQQAAMGPPPRPRLPRGVKKDESGLLYYDGRAYADVNYQQYPNPAYRMAANTSTPPAASPEQVNGRRVSGGSSGGPEYGGPCYSCGDMYGQACGGCNGAGCGGCGACGPGCHGGLLGWLFGSRGFPGKLGYNWTFSADALFIKRDAGSDQDLVLNSLDEVVVNASDIHFDFEDGFRLMAGVMGPSGLTYQFVYTGISPWKDGAGAVGIADLRIPDPLGAVQPGFSNSDSIFVTYISTLRSAELNLIYPWGSFNLLAGYRWLGLDEHANLRSTTFGPVTSDFDAFSSNQLNGGQIGILGEWEMCGLLNFDFWAKWGVFNNSAHEHQIAVDRTISDEPFLNSSNTNSIAAYVSEIGGQFLVPLGAMARFEAGYQVYFINNLALAPDQFDFNVLALDGPTNVNFGGNVVLHGCHFGFTFNW